MKYKTGNAKSRMIMFAIGCCMLLLAGKQAHAVVFTGADPNDNLFSTTNNWDVFPTAGIAVNSFDNTDAGNPAQLDPAFNAVVANLGNVTIATPGAGTAYVEVLNGATNKATNLYVGNIAQLLRGGVLTFDAGSGLMPTTANSGLFRIGVKGPGMAVAKDGMASFGFANLELGTNGTLVFEFGTNSVSTFVSTKSNGAASMILDGVIELDLSAMPATGTYTLIQCNHASTTLTGAFTTWLSGQGGSFSSTGSYDGSNFKVLNGGNTGWTLQIASNTLEFVVDVAGHYVAEGATQDTSLRSSGANVQADLGGADQLFVAFDEGIRGVLEFDLSGADLPITNAVLTLTQTAARTGTWDFSVYPMVYTANNYDWYEGTGTWIFAATTNAPAATNGAACYKYRQDDATTPLAWEDGVGNPLANAGNSALWGAAIGSTSGTDSVAGRQLDFVLDASVLENFRTNGVGRITIGVWGPASFDNNNHFFASKESATAGWRPRLELLMGAGAEPPAAPNITSISVGVVGGGNSAASVVFDASASASLWFTPDLVFPTWTNVVSGASPLSHTNDAPTGFYKVTIP